MIKIEDLNIKIFSDGADKEGMLEMNSKAFISGLTTNPSLMKKAGIKDYEAFAKDILSIIKKKPISFEVFSDDFDDMEKQAMKIASWADNVYAKIPITNTKRESSKELIKRLVERKVKLNITAIMTLDQVKKIIPVLSQNVPSILSVFAGRIADTGQDPIPLMKNCLKEMKINSKSELLWASTREFLNIIQADQIGCHIITAPNDIIKKLELINYNLEDYSLDTVKTFYKDAVDANFKIN
jgi:transaldolase|tara:strand:+ start:3892 stop:4611 length:720 start_codon:yes stop_codon:yes gene_type:complete